MLWSWRLWAPSCLGRIAQPGWGSLRISPPAAAPGAALWFLYELPPAIKSQGSEDAGVRVGVRSQGHKARGAPAPGWVLPSRCWGAGMGPVLGTPCPEMAPGLGTLCPGWPQGGSGHLCPQESPAGPGCRAGAARQGARALLGPPRPGLDGAARGAGGCCGPQGMGTVVPRGEGLCSEGQGPRGRRAVVPVGEGLRSPWVTDHGHQRGGSP